MSDIDSCVVPGALLSGVKAPSEVPGIAFGRVAGGRPHTFWLGRRRWNAALSGCALGGLMWAVSAFLANELYAAPLLTKEIGAVVVLLAVGGLGSLGWGLNALLGRFIFDQRGVRLSAAASGFAVAWQDLTAWEVRSQPNFVGGPGVRLWLRQALAPITVPGDWLSAEDCGTIHAILRATVPELEGAAHR